MLGAYIGGDCWSLFSVVTSGVRYMGKRIKGGGACVVCREGKEGLERSACASHWQNHGKRSAYLALVPRSKFGLKTIATRKAELRQRGKDNVWICFGCNDQGFFLKEKMSLRWLPQSTWTTAEKYTHERTTSKGNEDRKYAIPRAPFTSVIKYMMPDDSI